MLVRGTLLKGWDPWLTLQHVGVLSLMPVVLTSIAVRRYQDTIA